MSPPPAIPPVAGDKTASVIAAAVCSMIFCITFYSLRIVSRLVAGSRLIWSDLFLFGGVIACFAISSIDLYGEYDRIFPSCKSFNYNNHSVEAWTRPSDRLRCS